MSNVDTRTAGHGKHAAHMQCGACVLKRLKPPTLSTRALDSGSWAMPMYTSLSMRPGRSKEGSSRSGRLVAPGDNNNNNNKSVCV
eukprot:1151693-Pelagomonas_calceolata.AAC.10